LGTTLELGSLAHLDRGEHVAAHQRAAHQVAVDDPNAALADGTHRQLGLEGQAELADDDDVERRIERPGDLEGDRHATTWQPQNDYILATEALQPLCQPTARIGPVHERHGSPPWPGRITLARRCHPG
jgi:hypothetical protein